MSAIDSHRGGQRTISRYLGGVVLAGMLLALPAAGRAAVVRTVCGSGCDFTSVQAAVTASSAGDGIEVMPGSYDEKVDVTKRLSISGPAGGQRPVIEWAEFGGMTVTIEAGAAGTTLSDLDIRGTGAFTSALVARGAVTATDLDLTASASCVVLAGSAPSQLGPGVSATEAPQDTRACVEAGVFSADVVTGVSVNAPDGTGMDITNAGTVTASTVNARFALDLEGGAVRRSTLNGSLDGVVAVGIGPIAGVVSDSVITSTAADGGAAVFADSVGVFPLSVRLRNVTAIASGKDSTGLEAQAQESSSVTAGAIDARNVIARGIAHDVFAQPGDSSGCGSGCSPGHVTIGYSNFRSADGPVDATIGHNQSADPLLVNPVTGAGQDFHIASASSPLIGAGTPDLSNGPADRDGVAHPDPPAIGAYEFPVSAGTGTGTTSPAVPPTNPATTTRPRLSRLAESNAVLEVARTSTPLQGHTAVAARKRGTVFSFRLDQPATVTVVISTTASCRRTSAAPHRKSRCSRTVATLTRSAHTGNNRLAFTGRIRGRPLKPARYTATFIATNRAGSSSPQVLRFTVVKPHRPVASSARAPGRAADLVETRVGTPPAHLRPGGSFQLADTVTNRGRAPAGRSVTRYYLHSARASTLIGARRVPALRPGRGSSGRSTLRAPAGTQPGSYSVVACADAAHAVRESAEANNCRGAHRRLVVTAAPAAGVAGPSGGSGPAPGSGQGTPAAGAVDSDGDGYPDNLDCSPQDPKIHPGARDLPDPQFVDSNCDGIDGTAAGAIFVSPIGDDGNPGTRIAPMRTFAAAIPAAAAAGKDVYATFGTYTERLDLQNGVSVYGAYSSDWATRGVGVTRVTGAAEAGSTAAAVAVGITTPTTLQFVTLAPGAPPQPGGSSYGLRGANSPGLRLQYVTALAAPGADGAPGQAGSSGRAGGAGADGTAPGGPLGGSSPVGHPGGVGGAHGMANLPDGGPGGPGQSTSIDPWGRMGGPAGTAGAGGSDHGSGGRGGFGDSGVFLGDGDGGGTGGAVPGVGIWQTGDGEAGVGGTNGHGGGGGGGGGADDCLLCDDDGGTGGGGGGGGQGGGPGLGGHGGGGSFGIFLVSSAGARLDHATIAATDGGAGGRGGNGAFGGLGGAGGHGSAATGSDASPGGDGGLGGAGGRGGDGGGGAGGPSIAVFGLDATSTTATTVRHGLGGAGGTGGSGAGNGGGHGVSGAAADYLP